MTDAATWHAAMIRARTLDPQRIAAAITATADTGLRATRYDAMGGRTTRTPCEDPARCNDGPEPHSHLVHSDPTGNAAVRGRDRDRSVDDLSRLARSADDMVSWAGVVLDWVCGTRPSSWAGVLRVDASLMPGTVQAGLDVDDEHRLPHAISRVEQAVATVAAIASAHMARAPSQDEQHWTAGLGPNDVCAWHLDIAPQGRYRRPRLPGKNICAACVALAEMGHKRPPTWLLEAEVERDAKPRAWTAALSRYADELGIRRDRTA